MNFAVQNEKEYMAAENDDILEQIRAKKDLWRCS